MNAKIENLDSVIRRIGKLLAIADDDRADPNEAAAAAAMAARIMEKYQLDNSDIVLEALSAVDAIVEKDIHPEAQQNPGNRRHVPGWQGTIALYVSRLNDCGAMLVKDSGGHQSIRLYGFTADVEVATYTLKYLFMTVQRLSKHYQHHGPRVTWMAHEMYEYRAGVVTALCNSLEAALKEKRLNETQHATGTALVVAKADRIAEKYGDVFGARQGNAKKVTQAFRTGAADGAKVNVKTAALRGEKPSTQPKVQ